MDDEYRSADEDRSADDAVVIALTELDRKLDTVAAEVATIAGSHRDLLSHVTESEARRGQNSVAISRRLETLEGLVLDLGHQLPELSDDVTTRLTDHTDVALAGVLRLLDVRLALLRRAFDDAELMAAPAAGIEAGAVMGATQAAWNRLEQRLDKEFDDLGRQLQSIASLIDAVVSSTEDLANRPVVSGDQLRKAASAIKDTVVSANRNRRDRRGGPKTLGS